MELKQLMNRKENLQMDIEFWEKEIITRNRLIKETKESISNLQKRIDVNCVIPVTEDKK